MFRTWCRKNWKLCLFAPLVPVLFFFAFLALELALHPKKTIHVFPTYPMHPLPGPGGTRDDLSSPPHD
jgi:hypothetical protein